MKRANFRRTDGTVVEMWGHVSWVSPDGAPALATAYAQGEASYLDDRGRVWAHDGANWRVTGSHDLVGLAETDPPIKT